MVDVVKSRLDGANVVEMRSMEEEKVMTVEEHTGVNDPLSLRKLDIVQTQAGHEQLDELEKAVAAVHDRLREMEKSLREREAVLDTKMDTIMDLLSTQCGQGKSSPRETMNADMEETEKEDIREMIEGVGDLIEAGVEYLRSRLTEVEELLRTFSPATPGTFIYKHPEWETLEPSAEEIEGKVVRRRGQLPANPESVPASSSQRKRRRRNRKPPWGGTQ